MHSGHLWHRNVIAYKKPKDILTSSSIIVSTHHHKLRVWLRHDMARRYTRLAHFLWGNNRSSVDSPDKEPNDAGPCFFVVVSVKMLLNKQWIWPWFETHLRKRDVQDIIQVMWTMTKIMMIIIMLMIMSLLMTIIMTMTTMMMIKRMSIGTFI